MATFNEEDKPTPQKVNDFHTNSDVDQEPDSQHHTLGQSPGQASPGNHSHNGSDSVALLEGVVLVGSRGGNSSIASILQALVKLGAEDNTTA